MQSDHHNDLNLGLTASEEVDFRKAEGAADLDSTDPADKSILDELAQMNQWSGLTMKVVYAKRGTAAHPNGFITLDKAQLHNFFNSMNPDAFANAVFFALAHEGGHQYQFKVFGLEKMLKMNRRELEAHADLMSGAWIALRMDRGFKNLAEDAKMAALQLVGTSTDYPTAHQRMVLVEKGIGTAAGVVMAENQGGIDAAKSLKSVLSDQDVKDTLTIAIHTMSTTPDQP